jgi:hypothetical protein
VKKKVMIQTDENKKGSAAAGQKIEINQTIHNKILPPSQRCP